MASEPGRKRQQLHQFIESDSFQRVIVGVILVAAVLVGLSTFPEIAQRHESLFQVLDGVILSIFTLEILLKMTALSPRPLRFFRDGWNVFDFLIVAACFLPSTGGFVAAFRLFRLLRVLRLITAIPRLQFLVSAMLKSLPSMGYVMMLLFLLFYVYAVMGVFLFRENDPANFGSLWVSLLTLFEVVTLEGWVDLMDTQIQGHPEDGTPGPGSAALPLLAPAYFVSFVLMGTMVMLNLVIGVIINAMDEAQRETASRALTELLEKDGEFQDEKEEREHRIREIQSQLDQLSKQMDDLR